MTSHAQGGPVRRAVRVRGVVQGVGFRPFVYQAAVLRGLAGHIENNTDGVRIEVEGDAEPVQAFLAALGSEAPPMARVDSVEISEIPIEGTRGFSILSSHVLGQVSTGIPADAATCQDCLRELFDPGDRRFGYAFINCTNCGPRFTITRRIPYDRPSTSMAAFPMCAACQAEYDDPMNRRFHAQPNACWECGPRVWLTAPGGEPIRCDDPVAACIERLLAGQVVAIKGIGGFHLSVDATNTAAVERLRQRKHRYGKPLAVMVRDLEAARSLCDLSQADEAVLMSPPRPIVLCRQRPDAALAESVAPGIPWLGIFLPYAPLQHLLFADPRVKALVMTSANLSEEPIAIDNEEALSRLGNIADVFLMHDRAILQRCDDSVCAVVDGVPQLIRRARGFVPLAVALHAPGEGETHPPLLAVGGHLKSVFTLARGQFACQSQHFGDLENLAALDFFNESLEHLMRTFEVEPQAVAHDLHPGYLSTIWAKQWAGERGLPLIAVQHHHAHIAGVMAEHNLIGAVIGLSLDGTGYGTDGKIWGGEVLIAQLDGASPDRFDRFAHLDYAPMPGGDAAVREPWRMAFGALHAAGLPPEQVTQLTGSSERDGRLLVRAMERGLNSPLTSSLGRLFDAVAAVVLRRRLVDYEAQAAIELEGIAIDEPEQDSARCYEIEWLAGDWQLRQPARMGTRSLWRAIIHDLAAGVETARISARFHAAVVSGLVEAAQHAREATGIHQVAMSGGCLHNRRLASLLRMRLEEKGFTVYRNRQVSPGDGGLSYGQAAIAAAVLRSR